MTPKTFKVTRSSGHRLEIELDGRLDADAMSAALDALVHESESLEEGQMLFTMGEFALPTLAAIKIEFSRLPAMFGLIRKFRRCALLADQVWLRAVSEIEGALIPGVEIKGFPLDGREEAERWLAE